MNRKALLYIEKSEKRNAREEKDRKKACGGGGGFSKALDSK